MTEAPKDLTEALRQAALAVSTAEGERVFDDLVSALGIKHPGEGVAMRATFIVDPDGVIRFVSVTDLDVGRNVDEVLRVLDALQTDELCPCNWHKGEPVLKPAEAA